MEALVAPSVISVPRNCFLGLNPLYLSIHIYGIKETIKGSMVSDFKMISFSWSMHQFVSSLKRRRSGLAAPGYIRYKGENGQGIKTTTTTKIKQQQEKENTALLRGSLLNDYFFKCFTLFSKPLPPSRETSTYLYSYLIQFNSNKLTREENWVLSRWRSKDSWEESSTL